MTKALEKIIGYAVHIAKPEMIILFGSYANGKNDIYSDVDLLVVTDQNYMEKELEIQITSFAKEYSLKTDVLIHTQREIEKASQQPLSLLSSIMREGKIVYEKAT